MPGEATRLDQDDTLTQAQVESLWILQAMFPLESELVLSPALASWLPNDETVPIPPRPVGLDSLDFSISIANQEDESRSIELTISLPIVPEANEAAPVVLGLRQPTWLQRADYDALVRRIPPIEADQAVVDYIVETVEWVRGALEEFSAAEDPQQTVTGTPSPSDMEKGRLERVWFWFPSLSSKEKRRDLVEYALNYKLTGFVLAGKPGLLCVEGSSTVIDRYMSSIKSESWSDIPSYQKKVTERKRDLLDGRPPHGLRKFETMTDITSLVPTYGQYNHRGEMGKVRRLMDHWGVGADFAAVVLQAG